MPAGERGSHGGRGLPRPETARRHTPHPLRTGACRPGPGLALARLLPASAPHGADPRRSVGTGSRAHLQAVLWAPCSEQAPLPPGPSPDAGGRPRGGERGGGAEGQDQGWGTANPHPQVCPEARSGGPWTPTWLPLVPAGGRPPCLNQPGACTRVLPASAPCGSQGPSRVSVRHGGLGVKAGAVSPGSRSFPDLAAGLHLRQV